MKITLIGPVYPYRGGIAHYNALLAQALEDQGHRVRLISFRRQYPSRLYPGKTDKDPSVEPLRFPAEYLLDPLFPWTWLHAARSIRHAPPDLFLFHWWTTFLAPAFTSLAWLLQRKVKITYLIHNVLPHEAKPWDRWMARTALRQGQAFIVQTPHERQRLMALIPEASQVVETPLPTYPPFGKLLIPKGEARQQLGLPEDCPIILFFGIVRPYKGLKHLVEALAHVPEPVHLVIAGEFWEDAAIYQQQIEALALTQNISMLNRYIPNEEAHLLFSAADGLVAPYVGGTQSAAAGLAMGYGLPMIVTDKVAAGLPSGFPTIRTWQDFIPSSAYAHIVPAADPLALSQAIHELITRLPAITHRPIPAAKAWSELVQAIEAIGQGKS